MMRENMSKQPPPAPTASAEALALHVQNPLALISPGVIGRPGSGNLLPCTIAPHDHPR